MKNSYYLFPFEAVPRGARIFIHGAGDIGNDYLRQVQATRYCEIVSFLDKRAGNGLICSAAIRDVGVATPDSVRGSEYDHVVVAANNANAAICRELVALGVPEERIVGTLHKIAPEPGLFGNTPDPGATGGWDYYYDQAENAAADQFAQYLRPVLERRPGLDLGETLDFACGRGRIAAFFAGIAGRLTCCDVNAEAVEHCRRRLAELCTGRDCAFVVNRTEGSTPQPLPFDDGSFTFIYSWDAMVHFDYKWLDFYLGEFSRLLAAGGAVLMHHSNYGEVPTEGPKSNNLEDNPGWRTPVTVGDVRFMAEKHGFRVLEQNIFDWSGIANLDGLTVLGKSSDRGVVRKFSC